MQIIVLILPRSESWHIGAVNEALNRGGNQIVFLDLNIETKNQVPPANIELESAFKEICRAAIRTEAQMSFERFHQPFWASLPKYRVSKRERRPLKPQNRKL